MKKLFTLLIAIFAFTIFSFAQKSAFTVQTGYSKSTGLVSAEYQFGKLAVTAGWMPITQKSISSYSATITAYTEKWNQSAWYASGGFASSMYRSEDILEPMLFLNVGYRKYIWSGFSVKGGVGYGWCKYNHYPTLELTARWSFGI